MNQRFLTCLLVALATTSAADAAVIGGGAGGNFTCEIAASTPTAIGGQVFCTGANSNGQLGQGNTTQLTGFVVARTVELLRNRERLDRAHVRIADRDLRHRVTGKGQ